MIVIPNKNFTADSIRLVQLLNSTTKVNMLKVCDKLDLYVSPNLKKDETAKQLRMMAAMKRIMGEWSVITKPAQVVAWLLKRKKLNFIQKYWYA